MFLSKTEVECLLLSGQLSFSLFFPSSVFFIILCCSRTNTIIVLYNDYNLMF